MPFGTVLVAVAAAAAAVAAAAAAAVHPAQALQVAVTADLRPSMGSQTLGAVSIVISVGGITAVISSVNDPDVCRFSGIFPALLSIRLLRFKKPLCWWCGFSP
jgi:hypothetical protein